eukprot:TRINITY_DN5760_c0_g1_i2.p1 TRINITY_DN5760_c0_g1~~TRINITY_DN5760_c0_g1_i2.p1  ORF type:complete len:320 (-),score=55.62 TRINITY_DN5760_c0_g1_i2:97-1056(-)
MDYNLANYPFVLFQHSHIGSVNALIELCDETLLSGAQDSVIRRWTPDGKLVTTFRGHSDEVLCLMEVYTNTFISGSYDKKLKWWNKQAGQCICTIPSSSGVHCLLRLADSFLCGLSDGSIDERKIEPPHFETLHGGLKQHTKSVMSLCELGNGHVVSGSLDNMLKVWNMTTKQVIHSLVGHSNWVWCCIPLRGGGVNNNIVASASDDKTIRIWDSTTGECLQVLPEHTHYRRQLAELSDGTMLSGSLDRTIQVWMNNSSNLNKGMVAMIEFEYHVGCMTPLRNGAISHRRDIEVRKTWLSSCESLTKLLPSDHKQSINV